MALRKLIGVVLIYLLGVSNAQACNQQTMLDLIGSLEAPQGYDQVYGGVKTPPPAPLTSLTIAQVLDWQDVAARTSVSTAAGRYQVIRGTLRELVRKGVVSETDTFNQATQDKIGSHLLKSAGYPPGPNNVNNVANRISGIWAALPRVSGPGANQSTYEGLAGNHALISADTFLGVMNCSVDLETAVSTIGVVRATIIFGESLDKILEQIRAASLKIIGVLIPIALSLLYSLAAISIVLSFIGLAIRNMPLSVVVGEVFRTIIFLGLVTFFITLGPDIAKNALDSLAILQPSQTSEISVSDMLHQKVISTLGLVESLGSDPDWAEYFAIWAIVFLIFITTAYLIALIIINYSVLILMAAIAIFTMSFGGLKQTSMIFNSSVMRILAHSMALFTLLMILQFNLNIIDAVRGSSDGVTSGLLVLALEIFMAVLATTIPPAAAKMIAH